MSSFITILLIGISLSMDAFSLSLVYGMIGITEKQKITLSIIVGVYHFIMPLIGYLFGCFLTSIPFVNIDIISSLILGYIGIDLILTNKKEESKFNLNILSFLMFGLSVSIDSLSVGIGLTAITNNYLLAAITFSINSFLFTYLGLNLGNIIGKKIGSYSKIIGGITLLIISIIMLIK